MSTSIKTVSDKDESFCIAQREHIICVEENCALCYNLGYCMFYNDNIFHLASEKDLILRYNTFDYPEKIKKCISDALRIYYNITI